MQPVDGNRLMLGTFLDDPHVEHHEEYSAQDYHGEAESDKRVDVFGLIHYSKLAYPRSSQVGGSIIFLIL